MTTPLRDPLEAGQGGGVPALSFQEYGKKKAFTGIIVPVEVGDEKRAYRVTQQTAMGTGEPLFFNKRGTPPGEKNPDPDAPRTQIEILLLSDLTDWAGTSENFQERQGELPVEDRRVDLGIRKIFVKGKQATDAFKAALKDAGVAKPEIGGTFSATLEKSVKTGEKTDNTYGYKYERATSATEAKARDAFEALAKQLNADGGGDAGGDAEPPF